MGFLDFRLWILKIIENLEKTMKNIGNLMVFSGFSMIFVDVGSGSFQNHGKSMKSSKQ